MMPGTRAGVGRIREDTNPPLNRAQRRQKGRGLKAQLSPTNEALGSALKRHRGKKARRG